jgi:hypothetical protein
MRRRTDSTRESNWMASMDNNTLKTRQPKSQKNQRADSGSRCGMLTRRKGRRTSGVAFEPKTPVQPPDTSGIPWFGKHEQWDRRR